MLSSSDYSAVQSSPGQLIVSAPGSSLFGIGWVIGIPLGMLFVAFLIAGTLKRTYAKSMAKYPQITLAPPDADIRSTYRLLPVIGIAAAVVFYAIGYTSGSIMLDRSTNTATMTGKMTAFLPAQHHTVPLSSITDATLDQKPNSRRIRLEVSAGQDLAFPIWSDRAGQQEAVDAINQFLNKGASAPR